MTPTPAQLKNNKKGGTIDSRRVALWQHLIRLAVAILYILCELSLGELPEDVKVGKNAEKK